MTEPYQANHNPNPVVNGSTNKIIKMKVTAGQVVNLSAAGSTDPDGNALSYNWSQYTEADSYGGTVSISGAASQNASFTVPSNIGTSEIHIVLAVKDNGAYNLTTYRRIIISTV